MLSLKIQFTTVMFTNNNLTRFYKLLVLQGLAAFLIGRKKKKLTTVCSSTSFMNGIVHVQFDKNRLSIKQLFITIKFTTTLTH